MVRAGWFDLLGIPCSIFRDFLVFTIRAGSHSRAARCMFTEATGTRGSLTLGYFLGDCIDRCAFSCCELKTKPGSIRDGKTNQITLGMSSTMTIATAGIFVLVIALFTKVVFIIWLRRKSGRNARRRSNRAVRGEQEGEMFLKQRGFKILNQRLRRKHLVLWTVSEFPLRFSADLLVRKRFKTYIAEVKAASLLQIPVLLKLVVSFLSILSSFRNTACCWLTWKTKRIREITFHRWRCRRSI